MSESTPPELPSEFELRRMVQAREGEYEALMSWAMDSDDFETIVDRMNERDQGLVFEALVHELLRCAADERDFCCILATYTGEATLLAHARLVGAAANPALDMALRAECLLLDQIAHDFVDLSQVREHQPWVALSDDDWAALLRDYTVRLTRALGVGVVTLAGAVPHVTVEDLHQLCDEAISEGEDLDWRAIVYEGSLEGLWPRAAEELAARGDTSVVDHIAHCADRASDPEVRARYRRAVVRLRSV